MSPGLRDLEAELTESDLEWISDFERAVLYAASEMGLTPDRIPPELNKRAVTAIIPVLKFAQNRTFAPPDRLQTVERLEKLIRGDEAFLKGTAATFTQMWNAGDIDLESARAFSQRMFERSRLPAHIHCAHQVFQNVQSLCDLGGGGGAWAVESVRQNKDLKFTIFDLDNVNRSTAEIIKREAPEIFERVQLINGNFFTGRLPTSNAYLLSNILHDWEPHICRDLLRGIAKQVAKGTSLFIHECLLNENKTGPKFTSLFNVLMLLNHSSQQFTHTELSVLLDEAGYSKPTIVSTAAHYSLLHCQTLS